MNRLARGNDLLVGPWDGEELLPPPGSDVRDVETQDEGERNQIQECIEIFHHHLEQAGKIEEKDRGN